MYEAYDEIIAFLIDCFPKADYNDILESAILYDTDPDKAIAKLTTIMTDPLNLKSQLLSLFDYEIEEGILDQILRENSNLMDLETLSDLVMIKYQELLKKNENQIRNNKKNTFKFDLKSSFPSSSLAFNSHSHPTLQLSNQSSSKINNKSQILPLLGGKDAFENGFFTFDFGINSLMENGNIPISSDLDIPINEEKILNQLESLKGERGNFFSKANQYFKMGGLTGKSSAHHYSLQGHDLSSKIEALEAQLAQYHYHKHNNIQEMKNGKWKYILDLHGQTVLWAKRLLKAFLQFHFDNLNYSECKIQNSRDRNGKDFKFKNVSSGITLQVVTGVGKAKLKTAIWNELRQEMLKGTLQFKFDGHATFTIQR